MSPVFRRILVGFDGSEPSCDALELALRFADPEGGEVLLGNVDEHRAFRVAAHRSASEDVLAAALAELPAGLTGRAVSRSAGSAARGLCEIAEEEHADLLVLGSHRGPDEHVTPGSTALRLLQGAPCALAIAPRGKRERGRFHHVGVAYDGSAEARDALVLAYALAERDGAAVSVYRALPHLGLAHSGALAQDVDAAVRDARLDALSQLDDAADAAPAGVNPKTVLVHGEPGGIAAECEGIVELLIMGSRGYGPLHRVLAGSVSEALMLRATQPVLVVPRTVGLGVSQADTPRATTGM
jgi:nucleotide-binding universal stress UspA family protein